MAKLLPDLQYYHRPADIDECIKLLAQYQKDAMILAGGTSLAFHRPSVRAAVDVTGLPYHACMEDQSGALNIGAMMTIRELETSDTIRSFASGILLAATDRLANTPLRNLITVGGNIMGGYSWSDLPVVLSSLDAVYEVYNAGTELREGLRDGRFDRNAIAGSGTILTRVILPALRKSSFCRFEKFSSTEVGFALVSTAVSVVMDGGKATGVRIVCGSVVSTPARLKEPEQLLEGGILDEDSIEKAAHAASVSVQLKPDSSNDESYRRHLVGQLISRSFQAIYREAGL